MLVVAAEIPVGHLLWQQAVAIGAEHVVDLREGERFLAQAFARVADGPSRDGHLLVVTGATGGVGASTLAVNLAFTAAESGKRTILIAMTTERASRAQQHTLREHLGDPALDEDGVELLRGIIRDTGALDEVERLIESLLAESLAAVNSSLIDPQAQRMLADLAYASTRRKG